MTATVTHQLPLFSVTAIAAPPAARYRHVVEVNECGVYASRNGWDWWMENILLRPISDRIDWLSIGPSGGIAQIPCEDKDEAEFVHGYMLAHGIHPKHAKVKRLAARKG